MNLENQPPATYREGGSRHDLTQMRPGSTLRLNSQKPKFQAAKPVAKGHEAFLKAIETSKAILTIDLLDDPNPVVGTINHSDKYTISVKVTKPDGTYQVYVVFKHAIRMFSTTPKKDDLTGVGIDD